MDDPLVGLTIWQSAQESKKGPTARDGFPLPYNEGVDVLEKTISNHRKGGLRKTVTSGSRRKEGGRGGKERRETREVGEGEDCCLEEGGVTTGELKKATEDNGDEEEEECELTESSMLCREGEEGRRTPPRTGDHAQFSSPVPQPQNFWLMRLFQSKLFDMSIAIGYFFKSKEADVQAYLGNKLFVSEILTYSNPA